MPVPAAVAAAAAALSGGAGVLGSAADLMSLGFTIADHLKAQEGLTYNRHAFVLRARRQSPEDKPASAAGPRRRGPTGASAKAPAGEDEINLVQTLNEATILEITSGSG